MSTNPSSPAGAMVCRELVEVVTAYLEGALPQEERRRFEAHVAVCPGCRTYLDQMGAVIRVAGTLSEDTLDEESKGRLLDLFKDWKRGSPPGQPAEANTSDPPPNRP